jgi:hypothetical protein
MKGATMSNGIYEEMVAAGVETANHESDLYVPANPTTQQIADRYEFKCNVTRFINNITGTVWFDIPFAYTPWWDRRLGRQKG